MPASPDAAEVATAAFASGHHCAESVLLGVLAATGAACACAPRVATGFGAGIARRGETCGALTGAVLALGLAGGRDDPADAAARDATYARVDALFDAFAERFGSTRCRELTGHDLHDPATRAAAEGAGVFRELCPRLVAFAAARAAGLAAG